MSKIETAGDHEVTVKTAEFGESDKGTPFVQFSFENSAGDHIMGWLYLSEAAFASSVRTLRQAFGFDGNFETLPAQTVGKVCSITTEFEEYDGKDRLKVKWINSLRKPAKPLSGGVSLLKNLTAMAARLPAEAPKAATKAPPAPKAAPAPMVAASPQNFGDFPTF